MGVKYTFSEKVVVPEYVKFGLMPIEALNQTTCVIKTSTYSDTFRARIRLLGIVGILLCDILRNYNI